MSRFTYQPLANQTLSETLGDELDSRFEAHKIVGDKSFTNQGDYSAETNYQSNDVVFYNDVWWFSRQDDNINHTPATGEWWEQWGGGGGGNSHFNYDPDTTVGLDLGVGSGRVIAADGTVVVKGFQTITLPDDTANVYVEIDDAGDLSYETDGWTPFTRKPVLQVTTEEGEIIAIAPRQVDFDFASPALAWSAITDKPTTTTGFGITDAATDAELASEATARTAADATLQTGIDDVGDDLADHIAEPDPHPGTLPLDGTRAMTGPLDMGGQIISNGAPGVAATDYPIMSQLNAVAAGYTDLFAAKCMSATNVTLSGLQTLDTVALAPNERVFLPSQTAQSENGPWLAQAGAWTRPADFAAGSTASAGTRIFVVGGASYGGTEWTLLTSGSVVDTGVLQWTQTGSPGSGEANQIVNINTEGVGASAGKSGINLQVYGHASTDESLLSIELNLVTGAIRYTVHETAFALNNLLGILGTPKGGTGHDTVEPGAMLVGGEDNDWVKIDRNVTTARKYVYQEGDGAEVTGTGLAAIRPQDLPIFGSAGSGASAGAVEAPPPGTDDPELVLHSGGVNRWRLPAYGGSRPNHIDIDVSGGTDYVLSDEEADYVNLRFKGTLTANINVIVPNVSRLWGMRTVTAGGFSVRVRTAAGSHVIPLTKQHIIICDGVTVHDQDFTSGEIGRFFGIARQPNAGGWGSDLSIEAGSAYEGGTDLPGGSLLLKAGIGTGAPSTLSDGGIHFYASELGAAGTTDNALMLGGMLRPGGRWSFGGSHNPAAHVHIAAGNSDQYGAPLKFMLTGAALLSAVENGTIEVDSSGNLYYTKGGVRRYVSLNTTGNTQEYAAAADAEVIANKTSNIATDTGSTTKYPNVAAIEAYVAAMVTGLLDLKGDTDASANPNYPAASKGDAYYITVPGKIGGASGKSVEVSDLVVAKADNAGGTEASVGSSWFVLEHNLIGALLTANNLSDLDNAATARANLGLGNVDNTSDATKNAAAATLDNKRITPRIVSEASNATPTPNADTTDQHNITALAAAAALAAPSGTPTDGQKLIMRWKDNGTARALTYNEIYRGVGVTLAATTVANKTLYQGFIYNAADTKWDGVSQRQEA